MEEVKNNGFTEYVVPQQKYNLIYRKYNRNKGIIEELVRYELKENNNLYLVKATYAKSLKPNKYYIVASSLKEAKDKFKNIFTWLNVVQSVELVENDLLEYVLTHPQEVSLR